jgi:hypothetical protein
MLDSKNLVRAIRTESFNVNLWVLFPLTAYRSPLTAYRFRSRLTENRSSPPPP